MDIKTLKLIQADQVKEVEKLDRLRVLFEEHVARLQAVHRGEIRAEDIEESRHALSLRLHENERFFSNMREGEWLLDTDIFGPVDGYEFDSKYVDEAARRARTRFAHEIEKAKDVLAATETEIAILQGEQPVKVSREGIFLAGQTFDALRRVQNILTGAKKGIDVIDGYIDPSVLDLFTSKSGNVTVQILTKNWSVAGRNAGPMIAAAKAFLSQYGGLAMRISEAFHDRFLIIDGVDIYHFGASIKDAGKKGFMFSRIEEPAVINAIRAEWQREWNSATVVI
jgi:hypothetical protein